MDSSSGSHKVVQIPEDTFRKMRDKLKKQDERIKSLEDQIISMELEKEGGSGGAMSDEKAAQLTARIKELEEQTQAQVNQIEQHKKELEELAQAQAKQAEQYKKELEEMTQAQAREAEKHKKEIEDMAASGQGDPDGSALAATRRELEEKEELLKYLMEREKQLLAALESQQQNTGGGGGGGSAYLEKGAALLARLEKEMAQREELIGGLVSKVTEAKEMMEHLKQNLLSLPTPEDIDNLVKKALQSEDFAQAPAGDVTYESLLERIKVQLEKAQTLRDKLKQEQESIDLYKAGLTKRFDYLTDGIESINKIIVDRGERLNSARGFVEQKYQEWKAQDEARAKEMSNFLGMIET